MVITWVVNKYSEPPKNNAPAVAWLVGPTNRKSGCGSLLMCAVGCYKVVAEMFQHLDSDQKVVRDLSWCATRVVSAL